MFQRLSGSPNTSPALRSKRALNRAIFLAGCLLLLWVLVEMISLTTTQPSQTTPVQLTETEAEEASPQHDLTRAENSLFSSGYALVWVVLAGGGLWALYLKKRTKGGETTTPPLQSLGKLALAPNQQVQLVACGEDVLLLGVTAGQITMLKRYDRDQFEAVEATPAEATTPTFASVLHQYAGTAQKPNSTVAPAFAQVS